MTTPTFADVQAAAARIAPFVHRTPVMTSHALDEWLGTTAFLKCEHLQRVGAFKYRGATNAVQLLTAEQAARGVAAHSSGNHGAALGARGAHPRHPRARRGAVDRNAGESAPRSIAYGAQVALCEPTLEARESRPSRAVIAETGAVEIHPFDNDHVIAGAGTAALELCEEIAGLDVIVAPVGGGGLALGHRARRPRHRPGDCASSVPSPSRPTTRPDHSQPATSLRRTRPRPSPTDCSPASRPVRSRCSPSTSRRS